MKDVPEKNLEDSESATDAPIDSVSLFNTVCPWSSDPFYIVVYYRGTVYYRKSVMHLLQKPGSKVYSRGPGVIVVCNYCKFVII